MRRFTTSLSFALLAACATPAPSPSPWQFDRPLVLLGEVHDNAEQHRLRLAAFEQWLARGARPALAMEQFDRGQQATIDRLSTGAEARADPDAAASALIAAAGGPGWQWPFYRPFIVLALRYQLPIVAANVPRDEARAVMRDGLAPHGFDAAVPEPVLTALAGQIEAGHCGLLDATTARRMALAQVARDQFMARVLTQHAERGVLLLAGNGHVRTDLGAPRWLNAAARPLSLAVGVLETGDTTTAFDRIAFTPAQARPDPCDAMRQGGRQGR